jgi:hypothetical protein
MLTGLSRRRELSCQCLEGRLIHDLVYLLYHRCGLLWDIRTYVCQVALAQAQVDVLPWIDREVQPSNVTGPSGCFRLQPKGKISYIRIVGRSVGCSTRSDTGVLGSVDEWVCLLTEFLLCISRHVGVSQSHSPMITERVMRIVIYRYFKKYYICVTHS